VKAAVIGGKKEKRADREENPVTRKKSGGDRRKKGKGLTNSRGRGPPIAWVAPRRAHGPGKKRQKRKICAGGGKGREFLAFQGNAAKRQQ